MREDDPIIIENIATIKKSGGSLEDIESYLKDEGVPASQYIKGPKIRAAESVLEGTSSVLKGATRLASGLTPLSPLFSAGFQAKETLDEGGSVGEAAKNAAMAGATDFALGKLFGLLPGVGKKLIKLKLGKFSDEVVRDVISNPNLTFDVSNGADDLAKESFDKIISAKKEIGRRIGEANDIAKESGILVNLNPLRSKIEKIIEKSGVKSTESVAVDDAKALRGFKYIEDQLNLTKKIDNVVLKKKPSVSELQTILDNVDNKLSGLYKNNLTGRSISPSQLTSAQRDVIAARNEIRDTLHENVANVLDSKGLIDNKKTYSELSKASDSFSLKGILKGPDSFKKGSERILKSGNQEAYKDLKKLDELLPEQNKFLSDILSKNISKEIKNVDIFKAGSGSLLNAITAPSALIGREFASNTPGRSLLRKGVQSLTNISLNELVFDPLTQPEK